MVFDKGPRGVPEHVAAHPDTRAFMSPQMDPYFKPFCERADDIHFGCSAGPRIRVGGRSLYWRGIVLRIERTVLSYWPEILRDALLGDTMFKRGLYSEVENHLRAWCNQSFDVPRNSEEADLVTRMRNLGFPFAGPTPRAIRAYHGAHWAAYSPLVDIPVSAVKAEHDLVEITRRSGRGLNVQFNGPEGPIRYQAEAVILCAGAVENARIVCKNIPGNRVFHIVDHHAQGWVSVRRSRISSAMEADASVMISQNHTARINSFVETHHIKGYKVLDAWSMGEQIPTDATRLCFDDHNGPRIQVKFTGADEAVLANQKISLATLADLLGITLDAWPLPPHAQDFDSAVERAMSLPGFGIPYYCPLGTSDHESCTLPLGGEIVAPNGELREFESVFVAGPCLFPRAGAANPSLTTLALSMYVATGVCTKVNRLCHLPIHSVCRQ